MVGGKMEVKAALAFQGARLQLSGAYENGGFERQRMRSEANGVW